MSSMQFNQKPVQSLKQMQRLIMSSQMQQAIQLMQVPVLELSAMIDAEMEQNPVLEVSEERLDEENCETSQDQDAPTETELSFDDKDFEVMKQLDEDFRDHFLEGAGYVSRRSAEDEKLKAFQESSIQSQLTLFEHLMNQARESFESESELKMAEILIGNFDESGFLSVSLDEISHTEGFELKNLLPILKEIQSFDPRGVGARSLQESLLIQLRSLGQKESLAHRIVESHYDDLLHNRIPKIKRGLKCTIEEIRDVIDKHISKLDLHPGTTCSKGSVQPITPDVTIKQEGEELEVYINNDYMPSLRLNRRYMRMLDDETLPKESIEYIKQKVVSAKWLLKNIDQRNNTLERIAQSIAHRQKQFFLDPNGDLVPLIMKTLAEELDLHESTIARAVQNKYVDTPKGVLSLRYFFTNTYTKSNGEDISSNTVRDLMKEIVDNENKQKPFSDEAISKLIKEKGVSCARRTVAKYRSELNIGNVHQRRQF